MKASGSTSAAVIGLTVLMMALCITETSAISDDGLTRVCRQNFRLWKKMANNKAFAASQIKNGMQGCGYSWAWETKEKAKASAMRECQKDAQLYFGRTEKPACRLVKVN